MVLWDLVTLLRRRVMTLLLLAGIGLIGGAVALVVTPTSYTATSSAYVKADIVPGDGSRAHANAASLASAKVSTFVPLFTSTSVAQRVIDELGLNTTSGELAAKITSKNVSNSLTITITASAPSREEAVAVADSVVTNTAQEIRELEGEDFPATVVLMSSAGLAEVPQAPSAVRYLGTGLLAGVIVGVIVALALSTLDNRLYCLADVRRTVEVPLVHAFPAALDDAAVERIRSDVFYTGGTADPARSVLVTAASQSIDVWAFAMALARSSARAGEHTVLVDARIRDQARLGQQGLTDVLANRMALSESLMEADLAGLTVLAPGSVAPDPARFLSSRRMRALLEALTHKRRAIVVTEPVHPTPDARILATRVDRVIVAAEFQATTSQELARSVEAVKREGAKVGAVAFLGTSDSLLSRIRYGVQETV
ncbi:MAG: hypothetical protein Q4D79_09080 [Propionibacteriaceae bacterium]|nr:hypothetical protein [Propionibacteriaceae bacterium]